MQSRSDDPESWRALPEWHELRFDNGMSVHLLPDRTRDSIELTLWVPAGPRIEEPGASGISHLLEHCYSLGSSRLAPREIDLRIQNVGGEKWAVTTLDYTMHALSGPADSLEELVALESDRFATLRLPDEAVEDELEIVSQERTMRCEHQALGALLVRLLGNAFNTHPYGLPITGLAEDLAKIRRDDVARHYERHYVASNAVYVLHGGFDPGRAETIFQRHLAPLPAGRRPAIEARPEPPQEIERRVVVARGDANPNRLVLLFKVPPFDHPKTSAIRVLEALLFGESGLSRELARAGPCEVRGGTWECRDVGPFTIEVSPPREGDFDAVAKAIRESIDRLGKVDGATLQAGRRAARRTLHARMESTTGLAHWIGRASMLSPRGIASLVSDADAVLDVTQEDLSGLIATLFRRDQCTEARLVLPPSFPVH